MKDAEIRRLETFENRYRNAARAQFESRVAYFHPITGGTYTSVTVRDQKTRWGSCSSKKNLNFNYRLAYMPQEILDYVVVHELAHLRHMDHSREFWACVERYLPDYRERRAWLKEHGGEY